MIPFDRQYPLVEVNLKKLRHNIDAVVSRCNGLGIAVTGVIKGFNGHIQAARQFDESACESLASSRLEQIAACREAGLKGPFWCIRVPMMSEAPALVALADGSLASEITVVRAIEAECARQGKRHGVILMADLGDLREGWWDKAELVEAAAEIEAMPHVELWGVGTNLGCYGAIVPTVANMNELVAIAEAVERRIGRRLRYISGGATTSLPLVLNKTMPGRVNHLRIGEGILQGKDLNDLFQLDMSFLSLDVFTVKAEVLEVKRKPSYPVGEIFVDCFGNMGHYENRGMRLRALAGIGRLDFAMTDMLLPRDKGIEVLGASSDHLILDVENYPGQLKPGDILCFDTRYATMLYTTASRYVRFVAK